MFLHHLPIEFFRNISSRQAASGFCLLPSRNKAMDKKYHWNFTFSEHLNGKLNNCSFRILLQREDINKLEVLLLVPFLLSGLISVDWVMEVESSLHIQKYFLHKFSEDLTPDWTFRFDVCMHKTKEIPWGGLFFFLKVGEKKGRSVHPISRLFCHIFIPQWGMCFCSYSFKLVTQIRRGAYLLVIP